MPQSAPSSDPVGVLLAGGSGSRMRPLTEHMNKHLIPVHMRPMIEYALGTLLALGLRQILVVTAQRHMGQIVELLGSGRRYGEGVELSYRVQDEARGIADALRLAESFAAGRRLAVILGDNVFDDDGLPAAQQRVQAAPGAMAGVFLAQVDDPRAYGVASLKGDRVVAIQEKPALPQSDLAVTGLYLYPPDVFDRIRALSPSARGEYEISDVNDAYARENRLLHHRVSAWFDAGEPGPWMKAQRYVAEHPKSFGPSRFGLARDPGRG